MLSHLLLPLIAAGSMTLTLYTAHLLTFVVTGDSISNSPVGWFFAQVLFALLFASAWQLAQGTGPLESLVSRFCRRISYVFVPEPPEPVQVETR